MPFYEYECPHCLRHSEVMQKISDKPLKKCPECGKSGLRKLVSAPVFRLKGSGWYETDFKSDKEAKRNLAGAERDEGAADKKAESKADAKADAKPEAKADSKADSKADPKPAAKPVPAKATKAPARRPAARKPAARKPAARRGGKR